MPIYYQNGGDDGSQSSSPPIAIPGANSNDGEGNRGNPFDGLTTLLTTPSSLGTGSNTFLAACRPNVNNSNSNSPWQTLGYSPMISGPRSVRLPNLDAREARRAAAAAANARLLGNNESTSSADQVKFKRSRSHSLGNEREKLLNDVDDDTSNFNHDSSPLHLGESLLKRRTPSGLSLLDLNDETVGVGLTATDGIETLEGGYGSTTDGATPVRTDIEPAKEAEVELEDTATQPTSTMRYSQSCSIGDLNPTTPTSPQPSPKHQQQGISTINGNVVHKQNSLLEELKAEFETQSNPPILSFLYALVNMSIVLPVLMSFGSIIYHDDFFRPYLSVLMKLTVISGAIHQLTFATVSSLPFAVGQVQDAGLIFLSAMARDLVSRLKGMGADDTSILATVTIGLSLYTALLGFALVVVGRMNFASYCQLLPSSVVGGYLAYIGFFCGQAGLALMASVDVTGLGEWYKFLDFNALTLLTPGVLGGCTIYFSVRTFRHMAVLPSCIMLLMAVFYCVLFTTGTSVQEATENGWIMETVESPSWYHTWDFLRPSKVVWSVLPSQTLTILSMISVVALSSSLDIAAIEIELKRPLDYNHELKTVGISNIISGLTGGYTGSYIFSQTIFSLRMGIRSRLMGYVLAFLSLVTVMLPVNILAYIPNFFFGSLLMMICLDLMFEWLIDVKEKVTPAEYVVLLSTFALLQILGVEFGIIGGIILYVVVQKMGYDVGKDEKLNEDGYYQ